MLTRFKKSFIYTSEGETTKAKAEALVVSSTGFQLSIPLWHSRTRTAPDKVCLGTGHSRALSPTQTDNSNSQLLPKGAASKGAARGDLDTPGGSCRAFPLVLEEDLLCPWSPELTAEAGMGQDSCRSFLLTRKMCQCPYKQFRGGEDGWERL